MPTAPDTNILPFRRLPAQDHACERCGRRPARQALWIFHVESIHRSDHRFEWICRECDAETLRWLEDEPRDAGNPNAGG